MSKKNKRIKDFQQNDANLDYSYFTRILHSRTLVQKQKVLVYCKEKIKLKYFVYKILHTT